MKFRKVKLGKYPLDLTSKNGESLPFIVITGKSGVGKTSALHTIMNCHESDEEFCEVEDDDYKKIFPFFNLDAYSLHDCADLDIDRVNSLVESFNLNIKLFDTKESFLEVEPIYKTNHGKIIEHCDLSNSERRIYTQAIIYCKYQPKDTVILIDEPETSLHPSLQYKVAEMYKRMQEEGDNQIIMATNSPQIVSCFDSESVFRLYQEDGDVKCTSMFEQRQYTRGCEPNDIYQFVFQSPLRDFETREKIQKVADLFRLHLDKVDEVENRELIESLMCDLGRSDPVIMRIIHKLAIIRRDEK